MLGMYVHTHWGYNRPYAARSWTLADWQGYLRGLRELGYDMVMLWPQLDCMPPEPTASDRAFLAKAAGAIDCAHDLGMKFFLTGGPNVIGNDESGKYEFENRPYFRCEQKVNPGDPAAMQRFLQGRRRQLEPLAKADALAIIDSDPGGYVGSTNDQFVELLQSQIGLFRQLNPKAELIYWMWLGWENYNQFWAQTQAGVAEPRWHWHLPDYLQTLTRMKSVLVEPWSVTATMPEHFQAIEQMQLENKRLFLPYGAIEIEPNFPLTNFDAPRIAGFFEAIKGQSTPLRCMGNAQTHCLQLPGTYLFAHIAQGGRAETADWESFADGLLPGLGRPIADAWRAINEPPDRQRQAGNSIRSLIGKDHQMGRYGGLLFGDPNRFLTDLADNLELRAALFDFKSAVAGNADVRARLLTAMDVLIPYQKRLGFVDAYFGTFYELFNAPLAKLKHPGIDDVLRQFHEWRDPSVRNGVLARLIEAIMKSYGGNTKQS
ncbi:MAG: hypothetical protein WCL16_02780 [bacterium]